MQTAGMARTSRDAVFKLEACAGETFSRVDTSTMADLGDDLPFVTQSVNLTSGIAFPIVIVINFANLTPTLVFLPLFLQEIPYLPPTIFRQRNIPG